MKLHYTKFQFNCNIIYFVIGVCVFIPTNNMAAYAEESTLVNEFEDDISSVVSESTVSTFTIDFGDETCSPSLQDAFLKYKKRRQVCLWPVMLE